MTCWDWVILAFVLRRRYKTQDLAIGALRKGLRTGRTVVVREFVSVDTLENVYIGRQKGTHLVCTCFYNPRRPVSAEESARWPIDEILVGLDWLEEHP
jgi:hypothetical protein